MSIFSRRRDLAYLTFFVLHVPVMLFVDLVPLYPEAYKPAFTTDLRKWYITTYHDRFFTHPPAWFTMYMYLELIYHVPITLWAIGALLRDDPKVPLQLLVFALETAITTSTCIADYLSWSGFSNAQKLELGKLYVPYLALSVFMGVDMYGRLNRALSRRQSNAAKKNA